MAVNYFNSANVDFDILFEPDAGGVTIPGLYGPDGTTLLRYAPRAAGNKIADVQYYHPDGPDVTNYWAGKGTVSYTVASMADVGTTAGAYSFASSVDWLPSHTLHRLVLTLKRDGTFLHQQFTRNFVATVVRDKAGGYGYHYPDGRTMTSGNWAQTPNPTFGDNYTVDFIQEWHEYGRWWIPSNTANAVLQPGNYGSFDRQAGQLLGLGTNLPLNVDRVVECNVDMTALANNASFGDPHGALRRYNRGTILCRIKRNGVTALEFRFHFHTVNSTQDIDIVTPEGGGGSTPPPDGGGGGGGGGGGDTSCIATFMWMDPMRLASQIQIGDYVDGSTYAPDGIVPRQVRQNYVRSQPCYRMVTESGIALVASNSTPMTMRDGSCMMFTEEMIGQEVLVDDRGEIRWEKVERMDFVGNMDVVLFNVDDQSYFAGEVGDRRIATHNALNEKVIQ